jgi:hypothetical protein
MTSYDLSRSFFNFTFSNPEKVNPNHVAIFFFAIEHCNRLGWKQNFGLPTGMAKEAIGIRNYKTYIKAFNDLVEWGFIVLIEKSKNQHSANIVALSVSTKALDKALDKAMIKHAAKQVQSTYQSKDTIDKPYNQEQGTINQEQDFFYFFGYPCIRNMPPIEGELNKKRWVIEHSRKAFTAMVDAECSMRIHTKEQKQNEYKMFYDQETLEFINYRPIKCKEPAE